MTKLEEIEEVMAMRGSAVHWDAQQIRYYGMLLVRAVRELGATCEDIQYAGGNYKKMISPDVLKLLEEI